MQYALVLLAASAAVVHGSPHDLYRRQGVTDAISPSAPAPSGCALTYSGTFGIAAMSITPTPAQVKRQATQIPDGQVQAGQISQINDGQIQAPTTHAVVSQIDDGQIQAPPTATPVSQIGDGQVQQPPNATAPAVTQISDAQPQVPSETVPAVTQATDAQPAETPSAGGDSSSSSSGMPAYVACQSDATLELTLSDGILKDGMGRTGYIASNFQFQFDDPPQAGSIFTSGFSVCSNGSLALGGSAVWWQCRSGDFFNLYDRYWAPQCNPVTLSVLQLQDCSSS